MSKTIPLRVTIDFAFLSLGETPLDVFTVAIALVWVVGRAINSVDAVNVVKAERITVLLLLDWVFQKSLRFASSSLLFMIVTIGIFLVTAPIISIQKIQPTWECKNVASLLRVLHTLITNRGHPVTEVAYEMTSNNNELTRISG